MVEQALSNGIDTRIPIIFSLVSTTEWRID